ncbi:MAG: hypothetical protein Fur0014_15040 [Rubrivivax sp.]
MFDTSPEVDALAALRTGYAGRYPQALALRKLSELDTTKRAFDEVRQDVWRNLLLTGIGKEQMEGLRSTAERLLRLVDSAPGRGTRIEAWLPGPVSDDSHHAARRRPTRCARALGTVTAATPIRTTAKPSGAGAVIGGVVGAVGGAKVGHEIENDRHTCITGYRIDIRFDDGRQTSITRSQAGAFPTGQRVKTSHGEVLPA